MRKTSSTGTTFITAAAIAFGIVGFSAPRASAQAVCANAGPFCIDGVITDANNSGVAGTAKIVDPAGSSKELGPINGSATKIGVINTAPTPMLGDTNPNAQVDLNTIYTNTAVDPNTNHIWYYFGWARDSNNGSGFISVELQKSGVPLACSGSNGYSNPACNPWSGRQTGDFIILWDQQGNATQISIRFFNAATHSFGAKIDLDNLTSRAAYSSDFFRGEAAIDFTAVVFPSTGECQSFANTIPGTVTGNSDTADYKDAVLAPFPPVSNCGTVTVAKVTDPPGLTGSFPYTMTRTGGTAIFDGVVDSDCNNNGSTFACDATLTGDGDIDTIENLLVGSDYRVVEGAVGPAFEEVSLSCVLNGTTYTVYPGTGTFPVAATKTTACTITNRKLTGLIRIVKVVNNGFGLTAVPGDFNFTLDGGGPQPFANGGTSCTSGATCKELEFQVGTSHDVVEPNPPANWTVGYTTCSGMVVSSTQIQTCTVTNTATQATPSVLTRQRVVLFDRAVVSGLRRATGEPSATVTFKLYATLAACNAQGATTTPGSETINVSFPNTTDTSVSVPTSQLGYEINPSSAGDTGSVPYFWRALYHQSGTNPPNADFLSDCTEISTVRIQQ
ncbi:MAG: hypothetical protein DMF89_10245 [Acidobacteria bacterium]|nr:MAG: hypothetical protein DMF89_10245 [Acidobacteriota bacterium]